MAIQCPSRLDYSQQLQYSDVGAFARIGVSNVDLEPICMENWYLLYL